MSGPIQVIPQPLLGFLNIKTGGQNPPDLAEQVRPTVELLRFYANFQLQEQNALFGGIPSVAVPTASPSHYVFSTNPATVPSTQWLWLEWYYVTCSLLAAETIRFAAVVFAGGTNPSRTNVGADYADTITARARIAYSGTRGSDAPIWVPPGGSLGVVVADVLTAATITVQGFARGAFFRV